MRDGRHLVPLNREIWVRLTAKCGRYSKAGQNLDAGLLRPRTRSSDGNAPNGFAILTRDRAAEVVQISFMLNERWLVSVDGINGARWADVHNDLLALFRMKQIAPCG